MSIGPLFYAAVDKLCGRNGKPTAQTTLRPVDFIDIFRGKMEQLCGTFQLAGKCMMNFPLSTGFLPLYEAPWSRRQESPAAANGICGGHSSLSPAFENRQSCLSRKKAAPLSAPMIAAIYICRIKPAGGHGRFAALVSGKAHNAVHKKALSKLVLDAVGSAD